MVAKNYLRQSKAFLRYFFSAAEVALVVADLNPLISEPIRFGSLFATQAATHNVAVSAVAFGVVTLLLDAFGAVAVADLLEKRQATKLIDKTNFLIKKAGLRRLLNLQTSLAIDFSITLLVGTPITLILKQWQDPNRNRVANLKLGLFLSAGASLVSTLQGGALVAGIWHPNGLDISLAALAILSFVGIQRGLKRKYR